MHVFCFCFCIKYRKLLWVAVAKKQIHTEIPTVQPAAFTSLWVEKGKASLLRSVSRTSCKTVRLWGRRGTLVRRRWRPTARNDTHTPFQHSPQSLPWGPAHDMLLPEANDKLTPPHIPHPKCKATTKGLQISSTLANDPSHCLLGRCLPSTLFGACWKHSCLDKPT